MFCPSCLLDRNLTDDVDEQQIHHELNELRDIISKKGLSVLHQNIRGLGCHISSICEIFASFKNIDIFSLSETHVKSTDDICSLEIRGYDLISKPRNSGDGGGVAAYISQRIPYARRTDLEMSDIECIWLEILLPKAKSFLIGIIYRPPDSSKHLSKNFEQKLDDILSNVSAENKESIITGDINCNYLQKNDHRNIKSIFEGYGYKQLVKSATRICESSKTLIDVILTNCPQNISFTNTVPASLSDHELIGCVRKQNYAKFQPRTITCRNYSKYDPRKLVSDLKTADYHTVFQATCVNSCWSQLKAILIQAFNKNAPFVEKRVKGRPCSWISNEIKGEMNARDKLLRKARKPVGK